MTSTPPETPQEHDDIKNVLALVGQLEDLVKLSLECEGKELKPDVSFIEVHKKLLQIQKDIQTYHDDYKKSLALYGLTPDDVRPTPEQVETLDPKDKKLLERIQALQQTCEKERDRLYTSMQADQRTLKAVKEELKDKSKDKIRRKGKFRGLGSKEGWIPT